MAHVVVVGSVNADLGLQVDRFPAPGETLPGRGGRFSPGGKGANQALAAALHGAPLGVQVDLVGAVGDDAAAQEALVLLRAGGVGLDALRVEPGPTGIAVVSVDATGENQIVVVPGANASMDGAAVERRRDLVAGADVVVLQGEVPREGIERAAELAAGRVVLNLAPVVELDPDRVRAADPLVVNEHEGQAALRLVAGDAARPAEPRALVEALLAAGCRSVVLTLGARGAVVGSGGWCESVPATPVEAVDTTGAGDAFVGVLAAELAAGRGLVDAARMAAGAAATTVVEQGAQSSYGSLRHTAAADPG